MPRKRKNQVVVRSVFSDIFVELGGAMILAVPGFLITKEWLSLTNSIVICILCISIAIRLRR